jgi:hypothetical protein
MNLSMPLKYDLHPSSARECSFSAGELDSAAMPSGMSQRRSLWAWLSFVVGLGLTIPLIWRAWTIIGPNTYTGGDGKAWQAVIREVREFAPVFHFNILNPLEGAAAFGTPINIWADPVYWPFLSDNLLFATQASTLVAYVAVAAAIFLLSRIWRVPLGASIAGSLSSLIVFPAFSYIFHFSTLLSIVPDAAMGAALMMIAAGISYWVCDSQWKTLVSGVLLLALWLGFTVYSNPSWFVGAGFVFAPLFAFCILDARSARVIAARIAAFAIAFALLYAFGPFDYVRTLFAYSARIYFHSEWARPQDAPYASWVFQSPQLLWTYLFLLSGWVLGLVFGKEGARKAAFVSLLLFAAFVVEVIVYLFVPIHWPAPLPVYYEVLMAPLYAFGAIVGYSSFVSTVWRKLIFKSSLNATKQVRVDRGFAWIRYVSAGGYIRLLRLRLRLRRLLSSIRIARDHVLRKNIVRAVPVLSGIAFVPMLGAWYVTDEIYAHNYTPNLINTLTEPWPQSDELAAYLAENIGLRNTRQFRGMALMTPNFSYENFLVLGSLWQNFVPSFNAYSTFDMPRFNYFITHRTSEESSAPSANKIPVRREWWTFGPLGPSSKKILQALGVSYIFEAVAEGDVKRSPPEDADLRKQFGPVTSGARKFTYLVYEYTGSNLGNYSPTKVVIARDASAILEHLWNTSFDPRETIILPETLKGSLVQARSGKMFFDRGAIRVQAESSGRSLLLLPVQYSHCLFVSDDVNARLLPANLVQTAVLFTGNIDLHISLQYGLFRPGCRKQDLSDLGQLGIFDDKDAAPPWVQLHPYAISSLADLPRALAAVVDKIARSP